MNVHRPYAHAIDSPPIKDQRRDIRKATDTIHPHAAPSIHDERLHRKNFRLMINALKKRNNA